MPAPRDGSGRYTVLLSGAVLDIQPGMTNISCTIERHYPGVSGPPSKTAWEIPESAAEKAPLRVLVVDDEPLIRWSVTETLADLGLAVEEASDAASALHAITTAALPFDVIVLDLHLPDVSDLSLLATIRQLRPAATVVLMTAYGTTEIVTQAVELGAHGILTKPFELGELSRMVLGARGAAAA